MNIRLFSIALFAIFSFAASSHAATLNVNLGNLGTDVSYSIGGALNPNIHLNGPAPNSLVLNNNAFIIDPRSSSPNNYLDLQGSLYDNNYLAVLGTGNPGFATFTLAANQNVFGFSWGSIDAYNSITITDSRAVNYTFSGADILAQIGNPTPGRFDTQTDISFTGVFGSIVSVRLGSGQNSFEAGNFSASATPIPASLLLFGTGVAGLA
ncbi:MAG: hypothetical protein AB7H77_06735, partial [Bdellovibrionales bacterium]